MTRDELKARLSNVEDNFVERKPKGVNDREVRQTVVAFANSVPEGREAVLFIGIRDDGTLEGVENPDAVQKTAREVCERQCYPPIKMYSEVVPEDGRNIVAVVISPSQERPHFAGPAFIRVGSESKAATKEIYEDLISSRHDKCWKILQWKEKVITVIGKGYKLGSRKYLGDAHYRESHECKVLACDPHTLRLQKIASSAHVSEPLENVSISYDEEKWRLMLIVTG